MLWYSWAMETGLFKTMKEVSGKVKTGNRCQSWSLILRFLKSFRGFGGLGCILALSTLMSFFSFVKDEVILGQTTEHLNNQAASFPAPLKYSSLEKSQAERTPWQDSCLVEQVFAACCVVHFATAWDQQAESRSRNYSKSMLPTLPSCSALPEATCLIPHMLFSLSENGSHSKQD